MSDKRDAASSRAEPAPTMSRQVRDKPLARKLRLAAFIAIALVATYAFAGFLLAPWMVERELPRFFQEGLHHRARIGPVSFNPFTLKLQVRDFALETMAGLPVLAFGDAVVDLEWRSLLRRAWVLDEVRLVDPALHLEIEKDGRLNLAALAPDAGTAGSTPPPRLALNRLSVANGSLYFADLRQGYRNRVERLSIELSSLSTLDDGQGAYTLRGETPGGAKLSWKGGVALTPLAATGTLTVANAALAELMPYVDDFTAARITAGHADLELPYHLGLVEGKPQLTLTQAKLELRELALSGAGAGAARAKIGRIAIGGIDFDLAQQHVSAKSVRVGASTAFAAKSQVALATTGTIALDGVDFSLGTRRGSARALALAGAAIPGEEASKPLAAVQQLAADGIAFDLGARSAAVKALRIGELRLALERDGKGELNLLRRFAGLGGAAAAGVQPARGEQPANWQASIAQVEIGKAAARYIDRTARTPVVLDADGLSGSFRLEAAGGDQGARVRLDGASLALTRLEARAVSAPAENLALPAVRLDDLSLSGARYDSGENALTGDAVRLGSLVADTVFDHGRASLLDLLPVTQPSKSGKPLSVRVKAFALAEGRVSLADRASGIALVLQRLAGKLGDISTDPAQRLAFDLSADLKSGGHIALRGRALPARGTLRANIEASGLALAPFAPLLAQHASAKLGSGEAALSGTLRVGGKEAKLAYAGKAAITNLALDDPTGVRLLGWKSLATESIKAALSPDRIDIDELRLVAPVGRLAIAKDGSSNISRALLKQQAASSPPAVAPSATAAHTAAGAEAGDMGGGGEGAVTVRRVRVEQGALDFSDDSLSPGFVAKIVELAGTANGLSSDREARSQFSLEGRVDEFGYARLSGAVNPFTPRDRSTFRVQLRNIDLTTVSPYAMRFAGFRIATGRLALDLNYRVRGGLIEGDNKITLERFTLGEHVESPDALKLPFELAVALLKDADGTISLQVPVKGDLDDPQFSLAPLVWKAVGNLIGNIIAAPFRALANLLGGGTADTGGTIAFDPGTSRLLPPEREKLGRIVAALAKRPELALVIPARYDTEADANAMKRAALAREIGRRAGFELTEDEAPGPVNLEDRKTRGALRALFTERFSKAELDRLRVEAETKAHAAGLTEPSVIERMRSFASGEPQVADAREFYRTLQQRMRAAQPLQSDALAELAQRRALAIEAALKAAGADTSRVTRTLAAPTSDAAARQVSVQLSLTAR